MVYRNKEGYADPTFAGVLQKSANRGKGARNRASGAQFEGRIAAACWYYRKKGVACIEKTPEPIKILSKVNERGLFQACYEKQAQPDYQGTMAGGCSVVFEAKYTSAERIAAARLTGEQRKALNNHWEMGAYVFVLLGMGSDTYRIPWKVWIAMEQHRGHRYIDRTDAQPYRVREVNGIIQFLHERNEEREKKKC